MPVGRIIAEFIEDGRKRKNSLRTIIDALLYVVKTGCQWRYLPKDFPKWQLVYYYFRKFETTGLIEIIHDTLREKVRVKKGKEVSPSLGLVDWQSVKTASVTEEKGIDGNKKVNGRKQFILTDTPLFNDGHCDCRGKCRRTKRSRKVIQSGSGKISALAEGVGRSRF
jgi:putative transposase